MSKRIEWKLQAWKISDLKPYDKNPRIITEKGLKQLGDSFDEIGFAQPVNINTDGTILSGHARILRLKEEKLTHVDCYVPDRKLTPKQEEAVIVRMNKNVAGTWDFDVLANQFEMDDLLKWGFEELDFPEIEQLINEGLTDEDSVPEIVYPITKRGDIWILGNHRLMCGDSTMIDDVEKLMNGEKADMVFTDPPYGISYQSNMRTKSEKFAVLENDNKILTEWINHLDIVSNGFVFIWTTWKVLQEWFDATSVMGNPSNLIVWDKGGGGIGDLEKTFLTDYEMALVFHRGTKITGKRLGSVWNIGKDASSKYLHPTQKPVELAAMAIVNTTNERQSVLDFFTGSGSTLIACEKINRKFYGLEMSESYCDVIIKRWEQYTGKKATLESTKQTYEELKEERNGKT